MCSSTRPSWTANAPKVLRQRNLTGQTPLTNPLIGHFQSPAASRLRLAVYRSTKAHRCSTRREIRSEDSTHLVTSSVCSSTITRPVQVRHAMWFSHAWPGGTPRLGGYSLWDCKIEQTAES